MNCTIKCVDTTTATITTERLSTGTFELIFLNSNWTSVGTSCYLHVDTIISYNNATKLCTSYNSSLPVFHSENDWVEFRTW